MTLINSPIIIDQLPGALGYISYNFSPVTGLANNAPTSQRIEAAAIYIPPAKTISNIALIVTAAGTSTAPAGFFVGLSNGTKMLTQSADLKASNLLTSVGAKEFPVTPYVTNGTDAPKGLYYVHVLKNGAFGGTDVGFGRGNGATPGYSLGPNIFFGNIGTSQTALPANGAAVTLVVSAGLGWFVAVT